MHQTRLKRCSKCGEEKPLSDFYKNSSRKDGLTLYCKACFYTPVKTRKPGAKKLDPDISGQRFGFLVVISRNEERDKYGRITWLCSCECGNKVSIPGTRLRNENRLTCGCRTTNNNMNVSKVINGYKQGAKRRGYDWQLTRKQAKELLTSDCYYCGACPSVIKNVTSSPSFIHGGIDRLDPKIGYTAANCVPCCTRCNYAKGTMHIDEFLDFIKTVHNRQYSR